MFVFILILLILFSSLNIQNNIFLFYYEFKTVFVFSCESFDLQVYFLIFVIPAHKYFLIFYIKTLNIVPQKIIKTPNEF